MRHAVQVLSLLALFAAAASCASTVPLDPSQPESPVTTVQVWNQNPVDMTLYVTNGIHRIRLGLVPGPGTRTFVLPPHLLLSTNWLGFQADPIGADGLSVSEKIQVHPGDRVGLTLGR
ncbi:hypothetical protein [Vitiosangium sp. GDMCC 1.1324]|uniref:hypothetical protein n=1 Tax=Vitiosangium sp. (strain GDMCC 1.1324) TaxID=2138576 RepID=UPI000D33AEAD|nr:hypothetical protein [Vitiosangium sp. GDMCC 1.1324]PTL78991.1 hypothetical protein DAT35_35810 [Vitiosangium sp. GDMCC 1.1324]